ncbi:hypothetical protein CPB83DRAFT_894608 [Crepidotus variabilis]|uniref:Yeast cell wall synthesis Kre9/Knh1-like N-terminal domain-containing protein n=1 Tax=Crepidotus variabilis TaxID=179855 RepID=A0A9P6EFU0_9AGAR|nr:hypothetical protein CPB83DRAFT_894608 [Crepidotus variabilis]
MFGKISLIAVVLPLAACLQIAVPEHPTSQGTITIQWTSANGDPDTWSFELVNVDFHDTFAIANNVDPAAQELTLTLPAVPARDAYTIQAVNIGNITDVYATSGSFSIGAVSSSSASGSSTSSSGTGSSTSSASTNTGSTTRTSTSGSSTGTNTGSSQPSSAAPSTFNSPSAASATLPFGVTSGGLLAFTASILAGAAMVAF